MINAKKLDNALYSYLDKNIANIPKRFKKLIAMFYTDARIRKKYLYELGVDMGEGTLSNIGLTVIPNSNPICVHIGKNVSIAPYVTFVCSSHANNGKAINEIEYVKKKLSKDGDIIVEDEVWIGANVTILPGVRIGNLSVIGAGSVVTQNTDPHSVYAGVPARKIRDLYDEEIKHDQ